MILVDTSVWVDHLAAGVPALAELLEDGHVLVHPFVVGELACGNLRNRREVLDLLAGLPSAPTANEVEALAFLEGNALMGRGVGYLDVHLLAAARLARRRFRRAVRPRLRSLPGVPRRTAPGPCSTCTSTPWTSSTRATCRP